jgi:hypothetical protein
MARQRSHKNKRIPSKDKQNEVTLELLLSDGSNYASWSIHMFNAFRTIDPRSEQILDKSTLPSRINEKNPSKKELRCL